MQQQGQLPVFIWKTVMDRAGFRVQ